MKGIKMTERKKRVYIKQDDGDCLLINMGADIDVIVEKLKELSDKHDGKQLFLTYSGHADDSMVYYEIELTEDENVREKIDELNTRIMQCRKVFHDYLVLFNYAGIEVPTELLKLKPKELIEEIANCNQQVTKLCQDLYKEIS